MNGKGTNLWAPSPEPCAAWSRTSAVVRKGRHPPSREPPRAPPHLLNPGFPGFPGESRWHLHFFIFSRSLAAAGPACVRRAPPRTQSPMTANNKEVKAKSSRKVRLSDLISVHLLFQCRKLSRNCENRHQAHTPLSPPTDTSERGGCKGSRI